MKPWIERPREEAHLLNPSFCSACICASITGYSTVASGNMPFPLVFVVLPIALHRRTRELLPRSTRTSLAVWLDQHADARVGLVERARSLVPFAREALIYSLASKNLSYSSDGSFTPLI